MTESTGPLPAGVSVGHWTDPDGLTGCTAVLVPEGAVAGAEVRGGGPGTRESDLLSPAATTPAIQGVLLTGGSAFGLAAADGVVRWLTERETGHPTPAGRVPLVPAAVVYDLMLGDPAARPGAEAGYAACEAAGDSFERGSVGAGMGCTVGKLLGPDSWTRGGLGASWERAGEATICALAVVNAVGDVLGEDGSVLAGVWTGDGYTSTVELIREGHHPLLTARESTTLACVITDARLTKTEAWLVARACGAGVARAVRPTATSFDGDLVFCLSTGRVEGDLVALSALAADATTAAIRDGVRSATGAPGCPSAAEREA